MRTGVQESPQEIGPEHLGIVCDVTHDDEVKAAVDKAVSPYGRLDALQQQMPALPRRAKPLSRNDGCRVGAGG